MARAVSEIEDEIRSLARPEQERLLRTLLEEIDGAVDPDADRSWLEEVQRRSAAIDAGLMQSSPAEEIFERVLARLQQRGSSSPALLRKTSLRRRNTMTRGWLGSAVSSYSRVNVSPQ